MNKLWAGAVAGIIIVCIFVWLLLRKGKNLSECTTELAKSAAEITKLQSQLATLTVQSADNLKACNDAKEATAASLNTANAALADLQQTVDSLSAGEANLLADKTALSDNFTASINTYRTVHNNLNELNITVSSVIDKLSRSGLPNLSNLTHLRSTLADQSAQSSTTINTYNAQLNNTTTTLANKVAISINLLNLVNSRILALNALLGALIKEEETLIAYYNERITSISTELSAANDRISTLTANLNTAMANLQASNTSIADKQNQINALNNTVTNIRNANTTMQTQLTNATNQINSLTATNTENVNLLNASRAAYQAKVDELTTVASNLTNCQRTASTSTALCDHLRSLSSKFDTMISNLLTTLDSRRATLDNINVVSALSPPQLNSTIIVPTPQNVAAVVAAATAYATSSNTPPADRVLHEMMLFIIKNGPSIKESCLTTAKNTWINSTSTDLPTLQQTSETAMQQCSALALNQLDSMQASLGANSMEYYFHQVDPPNIVAISQYTTFNRVVWLRFLIVNYKIYNDFSVFAETMKNATLNYNNKPGAVTWRDRFITNFITPSSNSYPLTPDPMNATSSSAFSPMYDAKQLAFVIKWYYADILSYLDNYFNELISVVATGQSHPLYAKHYDNHVNSLVYYCITHMQVSDMTTYNNIIIKPVASITSVNPDNYWAGFRNLFGQYVAEDIPANQAPNGTISGSNLAFFPYMVLRASNYASGQTPVHLSSYTDKATALAAWRQAHPKLP